MDMVCIVFEDQQMADACLTELRSLRDQVLLDLDDACVAIRDESGKVSSAGLTKPCRGAACCSASGLSPLLRRLEHHTLS